MDGERSTKRSLREFEKKHLRQIDDRNWESMSPETLKIIDQGIDQKRLDLAKEMADQQKELDRLTTDEQLDELRRTRVRIRRQRREFNRLGDYQSRAFCERQEKLIWNGKEGTLTPRGAKFLDHSVRFLIFVVLGILTLEMFFYEQLRVAGHLKTFFFIDLFACTIFQFEFWLGFYHAESRRWYWKHHWIDFVSSIPLPSPDAFPAHQWGRLLRLVRIFRLWRAVRILAFAFRGATRIRQSSLQAIELTLILMVVFTVIGAAAMLTLEGKNLAAFSQDAITEGNAELVVTDADGTLGIAQNAVWAIPEAQSDSSEPEVPQSVMIGESAWWTFATVTTGGFADLYPPRTIGGRVLTAFLILAGAGLIAVFTATITTVFVHSEADEFRDTQDALLSRHDDLENALKALQASVDSLRGSGATQ